KRNIYQASISSRSLYKFIENFELENIKNLNDKIKCAFLRGLYDAEGHITKNKGTINSVVIGFTNKNKKIIRLVKDILVSIEISYKEYAITGSSFNPIGKYWCLKILRKTDVMKYYKMIGFSIQRKQEKLENFVEKEEFLDIVKSTQGLIRYKSINNCYWHGGEDLNKVIKLRTEGKTYNDIHKLTNIPEGTLSKWLRNERRPFRVFVEQNKNGGQNSNPM
ncbi:MAG: hypothetical protein KKA41_17340, partial [Proteobacteria bacterium]|nr:hypothetical protein [Pseudomonadota bacterium]